MRFLKLLISLITFIIASNSFAQQAAMFSQNMFNYNYLNPGHFTMNESICLSGITRQQWVGFKDSNGNALGPQTYLLSFSAPVEVLKGGIGGSIIEDKIGPFKDIGFNIGYAYKTKFKQGELGLGLQLSLLNHRIDYSKFIPLNPEDPVLINTGETSDLMTDFALGMFYKVPNQYYIGVSLTNIMEAKGNNFGDGVQSAPSTDRTAYLVAGYELSFKRNPLLKFKPSLLVKSNFSQTQISLSGLMLYNNKFWGGVTYNVQTTDAIALLIGLNLKDLKIGYSYDLPLSSINTKGSHEIMLSYCFKLSIKKKKEAYRNTRFL